MNLRIVFAAGALFLGLFVSRAQDATQADAEKYIKESESQWAEATAKHDAAFVERILADDFVGVQPNGSLYTKADEVASMRKQESEFITNHLVQVKVRFYGDAAVAQGSEAWEKRDGQPKRGRYVWTDTWIKRNGHWQVVAAEDVLVPGK
jgi:ketosteroid isomerase-like protein